MVKIGVLFIKELKSRRVAMFKIRALLCVYLLNMATSRVLCIFKNNYKMLNRMQKYCILFGLSGFDRNNKKIMHRNYTVTHIYYGL